ncbi:hypothetical protein [Citricoccus sp.]|uniref:hypothetical protein n=1 Tax=Citricoccus sp. TaxID=1978372 RepID=UPI0028BD40CE|nr:hypothetical protein [Citricoccus sp.]
MTFPPDGSADTPASTPADEPTTPGPNRPEVARQAPVQPEAERRATGSPASPEPDALDRRTLVVRRAPKVQMFLIGGALLGVIVALLVTAVGEANPEFTFGSTFGYFLVIFGVLGVGAGALVWLVLDRRSKKHTYTVTAQSVDRYEDADYAVQDHDLQQWTDKWENGERDQDAR